MAGDVPTLSKKCLCFCRHKRSVMFLAFCHPEYPVGSRCGRLPPSPPPPDVTVRSWTCTLNVLWQVLLKWQYRALPVPYKYEHISSFQTFWGARFYPVKFLCADFETAVPFSQGSWRNFFLFKQETKEINQCPAALGILIWTQYPWQQLKLWSVGFGSSCVAVKPDYTHIVTTKQLVTVVSSEFFFLSVMTKGYRLCAIMSSDFCHMWHVCFPETHWYVFPCYFSAGVLYNISVSLVAFTCTWREPAGRSIIQM